MRFGKACSILVLELSLLVSLSGCGVSKQVVVPDSSVEDLRSPAWIIHGVPPGARMPDEGED
jgi:hypothetical protein